MPPISGRSSLVRISDFFLLSRKFQLMLSAVSSSTTYSTSCCELDITRMSSAKASKSPLFLISSSFLDDLSASSKYTLNSTGERIEPCGSPISALILWVPTYIVDSLCSLTMSSTSDFSLWDLHRSLRSFQSITRSTESYAFCKSIRRLNLRFLNPCTSLRSRLAWMAVDLPSLKPVWYTLEDIMWGQVDLIRSRIAFSMIFDRCDLTTMGLISSRLQGPFVNVFCSGTSRPILRYSGI